MHLPTVHLGPSKSTPADRRQNAQSHFSTDVALQHCCSPAPSAGVYSAMATSLTPAVYQVQLVADDAAVYTGW